tara:strand:+ start:1056 stop:1934 length:879 start_codon:yes stop_codon:yes gene_type:complete
MSAEVIIGTTISVLGSIFGGNKAANAAREQARLQNEMMERQFAYDTEAWEMGKDKLYDDWLHATESVRIAAENEARLAEWTDATNLLNYQQQLRIRDAEQKSLEQQYKKSTEIFNKQLSYNANSAQTAKEQEALKLEQITDEASFNANETRLEQLQLEAELLAGNGRGAGLSKLTQGTLSELSRSLTAMNISVLNAESSAANTYKSITTDYQAANLAAQSSKMLPPGELPMPVIPLKTPMAEFQYPRRLTKEDFGPAPIKGAKADPNAAASRVWGQTISSTAGTLGAGIMQL